MPLGGQDHTFHCGFKEKKRTLTVNAGSGGKVTPSGTKEYQVEKPISITATPNSGYEFSGWSITGGDVTIANSNSSSTTATLHNSNSTITARFKETTSKHVVVIEYFYWDESINDYKILTPPNYLYFYDIKTMTKIQGGAYAKGTEIAGDLTTEEISSGDSPTGNRMTFEYCTVNGARSTAHIGFTVQTTTFVYVYFRDAL
ncbi:MAG: InlB B-repeat-containing protein [Phocaeicola massiliensis]